MSVIAERLLAWPEETPVILLSPIPADLRANPKQLLADLARQGFLRVRIGSDIVETEEASPDALADLSLRADIVVDRLKLRKSSRGRLTESLDLASRLSRRPCFSNESQNPGRNRVFNQFQLPAL